MTFFVISLIVNSLWHFAASNPLILGDSEFLQDISPAGQCPKVDGPYPVYLADTINKSLYYICRNGIPVPNPCPEGTEFNIYKRACVKPRLRFPVGECTENNDVQTFLPDSEDPTIYYQCVNGVAVLMECPSGLVFNPKLNVCDWPVKINQPRGECPDKYDGEIVLLADQISCEIYYVCFEGKPIMATCPAGLVFNPEMSYCDFRANVQCPEDKEKEEDQEEEEKEEEEEEEDKKEEKEEEPAEEEEQEINL